MKVIALSLIGFIPIMGHSQDMAYARKMVDTLSSSTFWGRGYTNDDMRKAADFLSAQFRSLGVQPMDGKNYLQEFNYSVNTFPGKMDLSINGIELAPGKDFIVGAESRAVKGKGGLE